MSHLSVSPATGVTEYVVGLTTVQSASVAVAGSEVV